MLYVRKNISEYEVKDVILRTKKNHENEFGEVHTPDHYDDGGLY